MVTFGANEGYRICFDSTGTKTIDLTSAAGGMNLDFQSETDYELLVLCGHGWVYCNDYAASPQLTPKSATSVDVEVITAPCCFIIVSTGSRQKAPVD